MIPLLRCFSSIVLLWRTSTSRFEPFRVSMWQPFWGAPRTEEKLGTEGATSVLLDKQWLRFSFQSTSLRRSVGNQSFESCKGREPDLIIHIMPPKAPSLGIASPTSEKWVKATWMPHTTLSQTSHVCLSIRSAHTCLDRLNDKPQEWTVRVGIYGIAGLPLVPVSSITPASPLRSRKPWSPDGVVPESLRPTVFKATHDCCWDYFIQMPVRWRDLPRDAYLLFEILLGRHVVRTVSKFY